MVPMLSYVFLLSAGRHAAARRTLASPAAVAPRPRPAAARALMSEVTTALPWHGEDGAGLTFSCTACGECCSGEPGLVLFSRAEGEQMAATLGITPRAFYARYAHRVSTQGTIRAKRAWSLKEVKSKRGLDCALLGPGGRCRVYGARPMQCSSYPLWRENVASPESWAEVKRECAGVARKDGAPLSAEHIASTLAALDAYWEVVELEAAEDDASR